MSLFVRYLPINNIPALAQILAWCWRGYKPLSEPVIISLLTYICVIRPQWVRGIKDQIHNDDMYVFEFYIAELLICMRKAYILQYHTQI